MSSLPVKAIELDTSIQCRAEIDTATVDEYAELMAAGVTFPPIDVYGTLEKCWIGDGWHRILAATNLGLAEIDATLHEGGRREAIEHALRANAEHGRRRTNADKRRAVEIALAEWPDLSSRQIAERCGVSDPFVLKIKPQVLTVSTSTVTGADGKQYQSSRQPRPEPEPEHVSPIGPGSYFGEGSTIVGTVATGERINPMSTAVSNARLAINYLERIDRKDVEREKALNLVEEWLNENK